MIDRSEHAVLNHLVETCRDGERGFGLASKLVEDAELKGLFLEIAAQRARFAAELLPHTQRLGGNAPVDHTAFGTLHRRWMALESALLRNDQIILTEVEQGNRATLDLYFDALNGMLSPDTREVVQRQFDEMETIHARIPARESLGQ